MRIRIDATVNAEGAHLAALLDSAVEAGFKRQNPAAAWTPRERWHAVQYLGLCLLKPLYDRPAATEAR